MTSDNPSAVQSDVAKPPADFADDRAIVNTLNATGESTAVRVYSDEHGRHFITANEHGTLIFERHAWAQPTLPSQ